MSRKAITIALSYKYSAAFQVVRATKGTTEKPEFGNDALALELVDNRLDQHVSFISKHSNIGSTDQFPGWLSRHRIITSPVPVSTGASA